MGDIIPIKLKEIEAQKEVRAWTLWVFIQVLNFYNNTILFWSFFLGLHSNLQILDAVWSLNVVAFIPVKKVHGLLIRAEASRNQAEEGRTRQGILITLKVNRRRIKYSDCILIRSMFLDRSRIGYKGNFIRIK